MLHPGDVPCYVLLSGIQVPRVIGKRGVMIRELRDESGATVSILDKQLPNAFQTNEQHVALIKGPDAAVHAALIGLIRNAHGPQQLQDLEKADGAQDLDVRLIVPQKCEPHLGSEDVLRDTRCSLTSSTIEGLDAFRTVRLLGLETKDLQVAAWRVHEAVLGLAKTRLLADADFDLRNPATTTATLEVPRVGGGQGTVGPTVFALLAKEESAWIIGKRGNKISRLRELARVNVGDAPSPPFPPQRVVLEIAGVPLQAELQVLRLVIDDLAMRQDASDELRLLLPSSTVPDIVAAGARASTANLEPQVEELVAAAREPLRCLVVRGTPQERVNAAAAIYDALQAQQGITLGSSTVSAVPPRLQTFDGPGRREDVAQRSALPEAQALEAEARKLRETREREAEESDARVQKAKLREQQAAQAREREAKARESRLLTDRARYAWEQSRRETDPRKKDNFEREARDFEAKSREAWTLSLGGHGEVRDGRAVQDMRNRATDPAAVERERETEEREAKEREKQEREAQEREVRERERQLRQREAQEREAREREARDRESRERDAQERLVREREARERAARYRAERDRGLRDQASLDAGGQQVEGAAPQPLREVTLKDKATSFVRCSAMVAPSLVSTTSPPVSAATASGSPIASDGTSAMSTGAASVGSSIGRPVGLNGSTAGSVGMASRSATSATEVEAHLARGDTASSRACRTQSAAGSDARPCRKDAVLVVPSDISVSTVETTLLVLVPAIEMAQYIASEELGIGQRTCTKLTAGRGATGEPLLRICGTPAANASACYLVQETLWIARAFNL